MANKVLLLFYILSIGLICSVGAEVKDRQVVKLKEELKEDVCAILRKCASSEAGVMEYLSVLRTGTVTEDEEILKTAYCTLDSVGYIKDDGTIDAEHISSFYPDPKAAFKAVSDCSKEKDAHKEIFNCLQRTSSFLLDVTCD